MGIKEKFKKSGVTKAYIANTVNINTRSISRALEHPERSNFKTLLKICQIIGSFDVVINNVTVKFIKR